VFIVIEAAAGFSTEIAGGDHAAEEWGWGEVCVGVLLI
jgi:hypothetical protein